MARKWTKASRAKLSRSQKARSGSVALRRSGLAAVPNQERASDFPHHRSDIPVHLADSRRIVRIRVRNQPVAPNEAFRRKDTLEFRIPACGVVVQNAHAMSSPHRFDLTDNAPAFVAPARQRVEAGDVVGTIGGVGDGAPHLHFEMIPPGTPAYKAAVKGQFGQTSWYPGQKPQTLNPALVRIRTRATDPLQ